MSDTDLIRELGGPTQLAVRLGFDKSKGGVQRVQNWIARKRIPAQVKLDHPDVFQRQGAKEAETSAPPAKAATNSVAAGQGAPA